MSQLLIRTAEDGCRVLRERPAKRGACLFLTLAVIVAFGSASVAASAQPTPPAWRVDIQPSAYTHTAQHLNNVQVLWCDKNFPLSDQMRNIFYNGQSVTFQFSYTNLGFGIHACASLYSGTPVYGAIATGSVTLSGNGAVDSLRAEHWNVNGTKLTGSRQWKKVDSVTVDDGMTNNDHQSADLCEAGCFATTYSYSTVPYYSLDQPRNITLVYHGDRVSHRPFVHADVQKSAGYQAVDRFLLEARKADYSSIQFTNGETVLRFAGNSSQQVRLGGQFDAAAHNMTATGLHPVSLTVTTVMTDGHQDVKTYYRDVLVLDERASRVARGWSIAGLQRLFVSGSNVVIAEGDGSVMLFRDAGPDATPARAAISRSSARQAAFILASTQTPRRPPSTARAS